MLETLVLPVPHRAEQFFSGAASNYADDAVADVFTVVLGLDIQPELPEAKSKGPQSTERTAIVGFSGSMRGSCELRVSLPAAREIVSAMMGGSAVEQDEDMVDDAIGELCNMIAGGWKGRFPDAAFDCRLSPPTVISGSDYRIRLTRPSAQSSHSYRFGTNVIYLTLHCEEC